MKQAAKSQTQADPIELQLLIKVAFIAIRAFQAQGCLKSYLPLEDSATFLSKNRYPLLYTNSCPGRCAETTLFGKIFYVAESPTVNL